MTTSGTLNGQLRNRSSWQKIPPQRHPYKISAMLSISLSPLLAHGVPSFVKWKTSLQKDLWKYGMRKGWRLRWRSQRHMACSTQMVTLILLIDEWYPTSCSRISRIIGILLFRNVTHIYSRSQRINYQHWRSLPSISIYARVWGGSRRKKTAHDIHIPMDNGQISVPQSHLSFRIIFIYPFWTSHIFSRF